MIGKKILHYQVEEKLGAGGMGVVYLARDTRLERKVAIKFLPPHFTRDRDEQIRFEIEAKAAAALNHPNIATIHAIEESDNNRFIVMEYIPGKELKEYLQLAPPTLEESLKIALQIGEGLKAAHAQDIIHRDIKSANIMITTDGSVKIMDFGLAKVRGKAHITQDNSTVGTAAYMSPEQARGDESDHRSDIWSFGVVLHEILYGQLPFKGDYEQAVIYAILNEQPIQAKPLDPAVPAELINLVNRMLAKNAADRPESMSVVLTQLQSIQHELFSVPASPFSFSTISKAMRKPAVLIPVTGILLLIIALAYWWSDRNATIKWAQLELIPKIESLIEDVPGSGEGTAFWQAFLMTETVDSYLADDAQYVKLRRRFSRPLRFFSEPSGANVLVRSYADSNLAWRIIGTTPIDSVRLPVGFSVVKLEKPGYQPVTDLVWNTYFLSDTMHFTLPQTDQIPDNMVFVPEVANWYSIKATPAGLHFPGLEQFEEVPIGSFLMDRFEITNREYKQFVARGGYQNAEYWKFPFIKDGQELTWQQGMALFDDKTGRPGPATWEVGDYAPGMADMPVSGISWYEAAAYAEFTGKQLPTIYHWDRVALTWASPAIVPKSNLVDGAAALPVGRSGSMTRFGIYDLAGNVREWCYNQNSRGGRFILGGGWNDPAYSFNDAYAQSPFDRSETNGFRCMKYLDDPNIYAALRKTIQIPFRDFLSEPKVSASTFAFYLKQFAYDKTDLNARIEEEIQAENYIRQKITFNAAYGSERMMAYLFLPKTGTPPYQTVVYFPGSGAIHTRSSEDLKLGAYHEFFVKSGRALLYPIYKSTYERGDDLVSDYPDETNFWKDHIIMWSKDLSRSVDYLNSRDDIRHDKLAYYGISWGAAMGSIMLATETRFQTAILVVAGLNFQRSLPEVDELHYVSRIKTPVLMLNGKYDFFFPYETSQRPFYQLLATAEADKKLFIYDQGHSVPRTQLVKESLDWLDRYLGPTAN